MKKWKKKKKYKEKLLEVNEGNDRSSFDMVNKSEDETVSRLHLVKY